MFSNFTSLQEISDKYNIELRKEKLLSENLSMQISEYFIEELKFSFSLKKINVSEYALCEYFISPTIRFALKRHKKLNLWSHEYKLFVDEELSGTPDYLFSFKNERESYMKFRNPLLITAEAKRDNFEECWSQCLAELIACQKINGGTEFPLYGIATNGILWEFAKLQDNIFTQDEISYSLSQNPQKIVGILDWIFTDVIEEFEKWKTCQVLVPDRF